MAKTKAKARTPARKVAAPKKAKAAPPKSTPKPALKPLVAVKPKKPTRPSLPLPPPPPPPPAQRDELAADRDIGRLLHYGERFGPHKIDTRFLPIQFPVPSGKLAICDPAAPKTWRVLDRPVDTRTFRVMLSVARDAANAEQLAAAVIHTGQPPIVRWTVAHYAGTKKPKAVEHIPRCAVTSGWIALVDAGDGSPGPIATPSAPSSPASLIEVPLTDGRRALVIPSGNGEFAAYWAVDAADKPVCLVVDLDAFTQKEWKAKPG